MLPSFPGALDLRLCLPSPAWEASLFPWGEGRSLPWLHEPDDRLRVLDDPRARVSPGVAHPPGRHRTVLRGRSEEHTSELQSLMRISYAVFCLKKKIHIINILL